MKTLFGALVTKRHKIIVKKKNVMTMLEVVDQVKRESKFHILMSMEVGDCCFVDDPEAWFVSFDSTDKQWRKIIAKLEETNHEVVLKKDNNLHLK